MRCVLVFLCLLAGGLAFADTPKPGGQVQMMIAKIDGDKFVTSTTSEVTRTVTVTEADGATKTLQVKEMVTTTTARELKILKATNNDGKVIPTADLKSRLKDGGLVVFLSGPLDAEWRKKFKGSTVFVEYTVPKDEK
jgi:hypothetical protein